MARIYGKETSSVYRCLIITAIIIVLIGVLLTLILVPLSFTYINFDQYAFKKSTINNLVDTTSSYATGRYFWGPTTTGVSFPSTYQHISYRNSDLTVFSKQGLEFNIEADIYYRLERKNLAAIFSDYGLVYDDRLYDAARASLKNSAVMYSVNDFINNRTEISATMLKRLNLDIANMYIQIEPDKLLLQYIDFPENLKQKFLSTAVQETMNEKATLEQEVQMIQKDTDNFVERVEANITIIRRNSTSLASVVIRNAEAEANAILQNATGTGIEYLFKELNITNSTDQRRLFEMLTLMDMTTSPKVVVGDFKGGFILTA